MLDPTLLLNRQDWESGCCLKKHNNKEDYVLVFAYNKDPLFRLVVPVASKKLGMKVIAVDQDPFLGFKVDTHIKDAGPQEFLDLYNNASFIITNSIHGTAFAVNFGIPFIAVKPTSGANRIVSLLQSVELDSRLVSSIEDVGIVLNDLPDFKVAHNKLEKERQRSIDYIENSLFNDSLDSDQA